MNEIELGSVDVGRLLQVDDWADWGGGLQLRPDGIYRQDFLADQQAWRLLSPKERAAVGEPGMRLLALPCTVDQLENFVVAEGLRDAFIDRRLRLLKAIWRAQTPAPQPEAVPGEDSTVRLAEPIGDEEHPVRKKGALIKELLPHWESIDRDLRDASVNGLSKAAAATGSDGKRRHGYWVVAKAIAWARERGKWDEHEAQMPVTSVFALISPSRP